MIRFLAMAVPLTFTLSQCGPCDPADDTDADDNTPTDTTPDDDGQDDNPPADDGNDDDGSDDGGSDGGSGSGGSGGGGGGALEYDSVRLLPDDPTTKSQLRCVLEATRDVYINAPRGGVEWYINDTRVFAEDGPVLPSSYTRKDDDVECRVEIDGRERKDSVDIENHVPEVVVFLEEDYASGATCPPTLKCVVLVDDGDVNDPAEADDDTVTVDIRWETEDGDYPDDHAADSPTGPSDDTFTGDTIPFADLEMAARWRCVVEVDDGDDDVEDSAVIVYDHSEWVGPCP